MMSVYKFHQALAVCDYLQNGIFHFPLPYILIKIFQTGYIQPFA